MIFACEVNGKEAAVRRCYGYGTWVELPEEIDGYPVTELGAYAFSGQADKAVVKKGLMDGRLMLWDADRNAAVDAARYGSCRMDDAAAVTGLPGTGEPEIEGTGVEKVILPKTLRKIGAYAFYNCNALGSIRFCGGLSDLGAGLFTGCHHVEELNLDLGEGEADGASCLREMLLELPEKLTVTIEGRQNAVLVFPGFFEESVENTPARILMTQMHGSGINYRNCFLGRKIDFQSYDACFPLAVAAEDYDTLLEMAVSRLSFPAGLSDGHRAAYETWLGSALDMAFHRAVEQHDIRLLSFLTDCGDPSVEQLRAAARLASSAAFAEGTALIMEKIECLTAHGGGGKPASKRFEL